MRRPVPTLEAILDGLAEVGSRGETAGRRIVVLDLLEHRLDAVEFGAVRRQEHQAHARRDNQLAGDVPAGSVHHHEDELVGVALGHFGQEHGHGLGVDPGQHEAVHDAVVWADGAEGIEVLALQAGTYAGPAASGRPAPARRSQQAEAPLVLEHQSHSATAFSLACDLSAYRAAQFF